MIIEEDNKLDFSDVLLVPQKSDVRSRKDVSLTRTFSFKYSPVELSVIPIISSNMLSVTTPEVAIEMNRFGMMSCIPKTMDWDIEAMNMIPSIGLTDDFVQGNYSPFVCLDAPHAHMKAVIDRTKELRDKCPEAVIIVGNVVTPEGTEDLVQAGADIIKAGVGSGSGCRTRIAAGVGYPQLTMVAGCSEVAHDLGAHVVSDGGCQVPGDLAKAFGAGADFVMLGGMLAGHLENSESCISCSGDGAIYSLDRKSSSQCRACEGYGRIGAFYGMSSERANKEFAGGLKNYRAAEGWEMRLPIKGPISDTLRDILGGLRSACSYVGARNLEELPSKAKFIRVNNQVNTSLWSFRT